jgi:hypothetical protein
MCASIIAVIRRTRNSPARPLPVPVHVNGQYEIRTGRPHTNGVWVLRSGAWLGRVCRRDGREYVALAFDAAGAPIRAAACWQGYIVRELDTRGPIASVALDA